MQRRLLDILADPDNPQNWPLKLKIYTSEERERKVTPHPHENNLLCKFYCYLKDSYLVENPLKDNEKPLSEKELNKITNIDICHTCIKLEVLDGVLYHENDDKIKWFIIDREIPVMYPLELRDKKMEQRFISKYEQECKDLGISV